MKFLVKEKKKGKIGREKNPVPSYAFKGCKRLVFCLIIITCFEFFKIRALFLKEDMRFNKNYESHEEKRSNKTNQFPGVSK